MPKKILIVDDSAFMRTMVRGAFAKAGYEVVGEVSSGEEALQRYGELKPDLVTMDIVMAGNGGLNGVRKILTRNPQAKILMVSAMGQQPLIVEAIQAGAKGFVVKPFKPEELLAEAKRILG